MRLRDLTPKETRSVEARREAVRKALAGVDAPWKPTPEAIAAAPFLDEWERRPYPGRDGTCLEGLCWNHPIHGHQILKTSILVHQGEGFAVCESGRTYILGVPRPDPEARPAILSGRRGKGRPAPEDEATAGPGVR